MGRRKNKNNTVQHEDKKIAKERQEIILNRVSMRNENPEKRSVTEESRQKEEGLAEKERLEKIYINNDGYFNRFKRGTVFHVSRDVDNNEFYNGTRILKKDNRPFVVISNCVNNRNSGTVTMAPIVTHEEKGPYDVGFTDSKKVERVVAVNQLTCIPIEHIGGYIYSLSDSTMNRVEKALVIHLALNNYLKEIVSQCIEGITGIKLPTNIEIPLDVKKTALSVEEAKALFSMYADTDKNLKTNVESENQGEFKRHIKSTRWKEDEARRYVEYFDSHTIHECMETFGLARYSIYSLIRILREKFNL